MKRREWHEPRGSYETLQERRGVLVGAFQSEREEETRDRAERGSAVRGSDQASVAPERIPRLDPGRDLKETRRTHNERFQKLNESGLEKCFDPSDKRLERQRAGARPRRDLFGGLPLTLREQLVGHPRPRARIPEPVHVEPRCQLLIGGVMDPSGRPVNVLDDPTPISELL